MNTGQNKFISSIAPWFSVSNAKKAIQFYQEAFDAIETYRMEDPGGGLVVKLSIQGAEFWLSSESEATEQIKVAADNPIRMILTVREPELFFGKALKAGAREIYPVSVGHGWKIGRLEDPSGFHWEIGHPVEE